MAFYFQAVIRGKNYNHKFPKPDGCWVTVIFDAHGPTVTLLPVFEVIVTLSTGCNAELHPVAPDYFILFVTEAMEGCQFKR